MNNYKPINVMIEAASADLSLNTQRVLTEGDMLEKYRSLETFDYGINEKAIPIYQDESDGGYFVELANVYPYMEYNDIDTVYEALNNIAYAHGLEQNQIGLLVESEGCVNCMINSAIKQSKKSGNDKVRDSADKKVGKVTKLIDDLLDKGVKVKKKPDKEKDKKKDKKPVDDVDECGKKC
jgi:hypothetical protein